MKAGAFCLPEARFDQLARWRHAEATFNMLQFGLRLGERPRRVVATTPRPSDFLKRLIANAHGAATRAADQRTGIDMTQIRPEAAAYEARRWLRHDWRRFVGPGSELAALYESYERKYDPSQPRVPAGDPAAGQWTSGGGGRSSTQVAGRISPTREADCNEQYRKDTFICNLIGTQSCWAQAAFRLSQCLRGGYIPPLYH